MGTVLRAKSADRIRRSNAKAGEPAWDIARLFPLQGQWTEQEYLALDTNQLIELSDGCLEFLPMPTPFHQFVVLFLFELLSKFVKARGLGDVLVAPLPVRLWPGKIREPDIALFRSGRIPNRRRPPVGADLAIEVVSDDPEGRERDLKTKREEYARARIPEYWIVDPQERKITVLKLDGAEYRLHGEYREGDTATSAYFPGFAVDVKAVFAAGEGPRKGRKRPGNRTARGRGRKRL